MNKNIKVAVFGSSGYAGQELVRLLQSHPFAEIAYLVSKSNDGESFSSIYGNFYSCVDTKCVSKTLEEISKEDIDLVFLAIPHGVSNSLLSEQILNSTKIIDLSGDFRIEDQKTYEDWYNVKHLTPKLLKKAVYGLPEIYREKIKSASFVANPGCYPTASILGMYPLFKNNLIGKNSLIIDAKSGVSGAGRSASLGTHFNEVNESIKAYKIGTHRHSIEMEQELSKAIDSKINLLFTPHLVPMNRGILVTAYATLKDVNLDIEELYSEFYQNDTFVRIKSEQSETRWVKGSNFVDISLVIDKRTNRVVVTSAIDNLIKGASGQAIQNMNLMFGFSEESGLKSLAVFP